MKRRPRVYINLKYENPCLKPVDLMNFHTFASPSQNCFVRLSHFEEGSVPSVDLYYQTDETNEDSRHVLVNRDE